MWPKDDNGQWIEPLDPKFGGGMGGRDYYDENNGYTYTWDVAQDFNGLFTLMGGTAKAEGNLDQLFREPLGRSKYEFQARFPDSTSMVGQFSMGNEPSLGFPISTTGSARPGRLRSASACCSNPSSRIHSMAFPEMRMGAA